MEVILLEKVGKLGSIGDKVNVKGGFARNFLLPFGRAVRATADNLADFEARRAELEKAAAEKLAEAQQRASSIGKLQLSITVRASEEGKLFGSIGSREIAEAFNEQKAGVQKSEVRLPDGVIRMVGEYVVQVQLHSDVLVSVPIVVTAS